MHMHPHPIYISISSHRKTNKQHQQKYITSFLFSSVCVQEIQLVSMLHPSLSQHHMRVCLTLLLSSLPCWKSAILPGSPNNIIIPDGKLLIGIRKKYIHPYNIFLTIIFAGYLYVHFAS